MTAKVYVHRPTEIEAVQWCGAYEDLPVKWRTSGAFTLHSDGALTVVTARGETDVEVGDYIAHSWGEYWPIYEPRFLATYREKP